MRKRCRLVRLDVGAVEERPSDDDDKGSREDDDGGRGDATSWFLDSSASHDDASRKVTRKTTSFDCSQFTIVELLSKHTKTVIWFSVISLRTVRENDSERFVDDDAGRGVV